MEDVDAASTVVQRRNPIDDAEAKKAADAEKMKSREQEKKKKRKKKRKGKQEMRGDTTEEVRSCIPSTIVSMNLCTGCIVFSYGLKSGFTIILNLTSTCWFPHNVVHTVRIFVQRLLLRR